MIYTQYDFSFSGSFANFTRAEGNLSVSGNYDKASADTATFMGTQTTIIPTLTTSNKTTTVQ